MNLPAFTQKPVFGLLVGTIILAIIASGWNTVRARETRAAAAEREAVELRKKAQELQTYRTLITNLEQNFAPGQSVVNIVEVIFATERIAIASAQSAGTTDADPYQDVLTSIRFQNVALGPLHRTLNNIENTRANLLIKELTVRKSIDFPKKLDVEIIVSSLETKPGQ